jgi:response regulator RpfG family c-di-GMP phosphodiesterase
MPPPTFKRPILIVDDEPEVLHSLKNLLRHDYRVFTASSGADGLHILETEIIHLVMTDQRMPEMTGVEMLKRVKNEHPAAIRLIFTGYAEVKSVIAAINQGNVFRFLSKPWEPEELMTVLRSAGEHHDHIVQRHQLMVELARYEQDCNQFCDEMLGGKFGTLTAEGTATTERLLGKSRELLMRLQDSLTAATGKLS